MNHNPITVEVGTTWQRKGKPQKRVLVTRANLRTVEYEALSGFRDREAGIMYPEDFYSLFEPATEGK